MHSGIKVAAAVAVLLLCGLALAACDDDGDDDSEGTTDTHAPTASRSPASSATPTVEPFEGGRDPVDVPFAGVAPPVCTLVDVRVDEHPGYDRAVFEFTDCMPGYRVEYVDEAVQCGSGVTEEVAGEAPLQVNANPAMAHEENGAATIPSFELTPGLTSIVELQNACDFEGHVTWAMGLSAESDFRVTELTEHFRLVVDVEAE